MINFIQRTLVGLVFIPFFLALEYWGGVSGLVFLMLPVSVLAQIEFYRMAPGPLRKTGAYLACVAGSLFLLGFWRMAEGRLSGEILVVLLGFSVMALLALNVLLGDEQDFTGGFAPLFTGIVYIPVGIGFLLLLRGLPGGSGLLLFLVGLTWFVDIFGYMFGKSIGRRVLAPLLSPKKTWEGAIGGVMGGLLWVALMHHLLVPSIPSWDLFWGALFLSIWGQVGDLCESAFKRASGIKDSGGLIPGHGGFLDRIDSLLFNAVAFYAFLVAFEGYSARFWV
ncbi:MAG: phosphatidate cytidylyltransferase [Leptospirales bacterium]